MLELIIDNFAGGGGASTGIEIALGRSPDYAINHDAKALAMHAANHPDTIHLCKSVWDIDPRELAAGRPIGLAWFSPDCTHFSKARGGKPADKNIRDLAWVVIDYAEKVRPRVIILENVEEFITWGPLDAENRPDKARSGETFSFWLAKLRAAGYAVEWRELRACDYGAPTIRKRFFLIARCDGQPISWPEPTHGDPSKHPDLLPWKTAADIIDWSLPCPSIFDRKKPLAENTLKRIARGLKKFVFESAHPFVVTYYGPKTEGEFRGSDISDCLATQTTENRHALVLPHIEKLRSGATGHVVNEPLHTITAGGKSARPAGSPHAMALVAAFLAKYYGGVTGQAAESPLGTITQIDHHSVVQVPTICSGGTHLAEVRAFLLKYYASGTGQEIYEPAHAITSKHRFGLVTVSGDLYQIVDIGMRMLQPHELFAAQGFPANYIINRGPDGTILSKSDQVRMCGNSVCPPVATALVQANCADMIADQTYRVMEA